MNKSSIFYSITFIFLIAAISIFLAFLYLLKYDQNQYTDELNKRYTVVSRVTLHQLITNRNDENFKAELKDYNFQMINQKDELYSKVLTTGQILQKISSSIGSSSIIVYKKTNYLFIESKTKTPILLRDKEYQPYRYHIIKLIFGVIFTILLIAYILTTKKLKPIKKIKSEIDKFAEGNLNINCKMDTKDEISEVANAFNHAVEEIKKLNSSRKLFLRNIMHELKTPITKGMISTEMLEESKQKTRLVSVFQRLESLLNEFIAIEQITAGDKHLKKRIYRLVDLIDEAIDLSMINREQIILDVVSDLSLKVDFKLFSIAIKNMIDNGVKYSPDHIVEIKADFEKIEFSNQGKQLEQELHHYIEPFIQGENANKQSFGLGLYIVDNILKAHNLVFSYEYKNGYNIFKFNKIQPIL